MKKTLILFVLFNTFWVTLLGGLVYLAEVHPLRPNSPFYPAQQQAEQWRLKLTANPDRQAEVALVLAERRLADLAEADESCCLEVAVTAFDQALTAAIRCLEPLTPIEQANYFNRLKRLLVQTDVVLAALTPLAEGQAAGEMVITLAQKIAAWQQINDQAELIAAIPAEITFVEAVPIPFLGQEVDHSVYPLTGGHAQLECAACHPGGQYADTPTQCGDCHRASLGNLYALALYPNHFAGDCADCHRVESWTPYQFDHRGIVECQSCHLANSPAGHYPGDCLLCHTDVVDWQQTTYVHTDLAECRTCHLADTPANHYVTLGVLTANVGLQGSAWLPHTPGACVNCHLNPADWRDVAFDHTGFDDCAACHLAEDRPENHYAGQCSDCHTTQDWQQTTFNHTSIAICQKCHTPEEPNHYLEECSTCHQPGDWQQVDFDHRGSDGCAACHYAQAPTNHYSDECSRCHNTFSWRETSFDHTGFTACDSCHSRDSHYPGQCSNCHIVDTWSEYWFDHTGFDDCEACHSRSNHDFGQCSKCHDTDDWDEVDFSHDDDFADCRGCHDDDAPPDHFDGQCSDCHSTTGWTDPDFDHTGYDDCQSCHTPPAEHWSGQCSVCHNTTDWDEVNVDHTGFNDCQSCHTPPNGHWPGQCSNCHFTDDWNNIDFDHTGYSNCNACHSNDRPDGDHPRRGQCSRCHTTDSWDVE